jgi:peptide/nickel transport system permease protein
MAAFILRRVLYGFLILVGVNLLTFLLFFTVSTPDDMARLNIGGKYITQAQIDTWKVAHGYDKPLLWNAHDDGMSKLTDTVFWERSVRLFALDFGAADSGRDIGHEISQRIGPSIALQLPVFVLTIFVSVVFSMAMVFFRGSALDFWGVVLSVVLLSISSLFYIIAGQYVFSKLMRVVPISGFADGWGLVKFLSLPILITLVSRLGYDARLYRSMFLEELSRDYVRTARAKGLSEQVVLFKHVLRNAMIPVITNVFTIFPILFLGSVVFESFFGIPGLGSYTIEAIGQQDFAVVRAMVFLGAILYVVGFVLADVAYTIADPRVRLA